MLARKLMAAGWVVRSNALVEYAYSTGASTVTLAAAPEAGDLLVLHTGGRAYAHTQDAAFTLVVSKTSAYWSSPPNYFFESSRISYKIATGSEGTTITTLASGNFDRSSVLAVYRFTSSVASVSTPYTSTKEGEADRSINITSYGKPNVVVCSVGSYQDPSLSMTDQNYSYRDDSIAAASSLTDVGSPTTTSVITANDAIFNEACTYAVLVPTLT